AEFAAQDLSGGGAGDAVDEGDVPDPFVRGDVLGDVHHDLALGELRRGRLADDEGVRDLVAVLVVDADDGGVDGVGAVQGEHIALAQARLGEPGGDPPVETVDLFVGEGGAVGAVGAVDQCRDVPELGGPGEHRVMDGEVDRRGVCVLASEHGSSKTAGSRAGPGVCDTGQYD